jgi:predicted  nucleic acid-binding Zn-ribbon protein
MTTIGTTNNNQTESGEGRGQPANSVDLDAVNLEQALVDFEVANARVLDLTTRLTELSRQLVATRNELEEMRIRARATDARLAALESSRAYQLAHRVGVARSLLRR